MWENVSRGWSSSDPGANRSCSLFVIYNKLLILFFFPRGFAAFLCTETGTQTLQKQISGNISAHVLLVSLFQLTQSLLFPSGGEIQENTVEVKMGRERRLWRLTSSCFNFFPRWVFIQRLLQNNSCLAKTPVMSHGRWNSNHCWDPTHRYVQLLEQSILFYFVLFYYLQLLHIMCSD